MQKTHNFAVAGGAPLFWPLVLHSGRLLRRQPHLQRHYLGADMTFKYTEISCYTEGSDGIPRVAHEKEAKSLKVAVDQLEAVKSSDSDIQYMVIIERGQIYPCWDTRVGAVSQPEIKE
jgi:hypothetical protein